jgi:hypothetical protein
VVVVLVSQPLLVRVLVLGVLVVVVLVLETHPLWQEL